MVEDYDSTFVRFCVVANLLRITSIENVPYQFNGDMVVVLLITVRINVTLIMDIGICTNEKAKIGKCCPLQAVMKKLEKKTDQCLTA